MRADRLSGRRSSTLDLKIVVLGSAYVGKTSIINRYCNSTFTEEVRSTIGAGFFTHSLHVERTDVTMMLWDTAGEERFRSVTPSLLRGAQGLVLVFDLTSSNSFAEIDIYMDLFLDNVKVDPNESPPVLLLGNKFDLDEKEVSQEEIDKWKQKNRVPLYYPVSAKSGENVEAAMVDLVRFLVSPELRPATAPVEIILTDRTKNQGSACCKQ
jgi:small GTP-binding protein